MLTNWFGARPARPSARGRFFRPTLERLENRLAPSSSGPACVISGSVGLSESGITGSSGGQKILTPNAEYILHDGRY